MDWVRALRCEPLMKRALQELVDRHPVMRTEFDLVNYSRPLQLVHREIQAPIEYFDLRDLASDDHRFAIQAWMETSSSPVGPPVSSQDS